VKGLFTQCGAVLLRQAITLDQLLEALDRAGLQPRRKPPTGDGHWAFGDGAAVVPLGGSGRMLIDIVEQPWPDSMGDPKSDPLVFGAWTMGHFGAGTFPNGLQRAIEQAWHWPEARQLRHQAFLRLRCTWVSGADDPIVPPDYKALPELVRLARTAAGLLRLPQAVAWFDPVGEVLMDAAHLDEALSHLETTGQPPLDAWTNVRFFRAGESGWALMDTVGMGQLDLPDLEAVFDMDKASPEQVARLLRNLSLYMLQKGDAFEEGHTVDGPDGTPWSAMRVQGLVSPPRDTRRFVQPGERVPHALLARGEDT
jgi:hypothetical protein